MAKYVLYCFDVKNSKKGGNIMIRGIWKQMQNWRQNSRKKRLYRQISLVLSGMEGCADIVFQYRHYPVTVRPQDAERAMRALRAAIEAIDSCLVFLDKQEKERIQAQLDLLAAAMR